MKRRRRFMAMAGSAGATVAGLWAALALEPVARARGQYVLDRIVAEDAWRNSPVVISVLDRDSIGALMRATNVPMGLESAMGTAPAAWKLVATGRRLREVLDAVVVADPRYEWREDNGVIVFRPQGAADDPANVLNTVA